MSKLLGVRANLIATKLTGRVRDEEDIMELMRAYEVDWDYIEFRYPYVVADGGSLRGLYDGVRAPS